MSIKGPFCNLALVSSWCHNMAHAFLVGKENELNLTLCFESSRFLMKPTMRTVTGSPLDLSSNKVNECDQVDGTAAKSWGMLLHSFASN